MKMTKGLIHIVIYEGQDTMEHGLKSEYFGIHKHGSGMYRVTHLPTGLKVYAFRTQRQARKFVDLAENDPEMPVAWKHTDPEAFEDNGPRCKSHKIAAEAH